MLIRMSNQKPYLAPLLSWERIGGRTYGTMTEFFRYDPVSGAYAGTIKIRRTLELAQDGQRGD